MANPIELAVHVAKNNKMTNHMGGLRISKGAVEAQNPTNWIRAENVFPPEIEATVDAELFLKAYSKIPNAVLEMSNPHTLSVKSQSGKTKVDLVSIIPYSSSDAPEGEGENIDPSRVDFSNGEEIEPTGLLGACRRLQDFSRIAKNQTWLIGEYAYITDGIVLVRTKSDCVIPERYTKSKGGSPFNLSYDFVDLVNKCEGKPLSIVISDKWMLVKYEGYEIRTVRYSPAIPFDIQKQWEYMSTKVEFQPLPTEIIGSINHMITFAEKDGQVSFGPQGLSLINRGKATYSISYPMPFLLFSAKGLQTVLKNGKEFDFSNPRHIAFKGEDYEGFWAALAPDNDTADAEMKTDEDLEYDDPSRYRDAEDEEETEVEEEHEEEAEAAIY